MDTITILRELWHRRLLVAAVVALSVAVGIALTLSAHEHRVGIASAHLLVDTPSSQVIDVAPRGSTQVGGQALLLAELMVNGPIKAAIARDASLRPDQISGTSESIVGAGQPTANAPALPYRLSTQVLSSGAAAGSALPIIEIDVQAPTPAGATRLAQAALTGVQSYEGSVASAEKISLHHRLRLTSLGVTQATVKTSGGSKLPGALAAIAILLLGCAGIVMISSLLRRPKRDPLPATDRLATGRRLDSPPDPSPRVLDLPDRLLGDDGGGRRNQRSRELIVVRSDPPDGLAANGGGDR